MKGNCICIPPELYDRSLHELHKMHLGIEKMQHRARATVYWPGIDMDIVEYVKRCKTCTQHKVTQHIQPMLPRDVPEAPWQDLAADFLQFQGKRVPTCSRYIQQISISIQNDYKDSRNSHTKVYTTLPTVWQP